MPPQNMYTRLPPILGSIRHRIGVALGLFARIAGTGSAGAISGKGATCENIRYGFLGFLWLSNCCLFRMQ